jgi:hypothetical protein
VAYLGRLIRGEALAGLPLEVLVELAIPSKLEHEVDEAIVNKEPVEPAHARCGLVVKLTSTKLRSCVPAQGGR